jgi:hypothetical protein
VDITKASRSGMPGRRSVLGGLAAVPVLSGLLVSAGPASGALAAQPGGGRTIRRDLVRGEERRYNAPPLTPGTRLLMPAGITAVPVLDYYRRPRLASAGSAWPYLRAADGTTVDASVMPEPGTPTRIAIVSGLPRAGMSSSMRTGGLTA